MFESFGTGGRAMKKDRRGSARLETYPSILVVSLNLLFCLLSHGFEEEIPGEKEGEALNEN
jgi:hypothetical protein